MLANENRNIINTEKLEYNTLLMNGYTSFQNKQITKALQFYNQAQKLSPNSPNSPLVKSIIGVLQMHMCNYSSAIENFNAGIALLSNELNRGDNNYEKICVFIKLYANLSMCLLVMSEYDEAVEKILQCLKIIRNQTESLQKDLFQGLLYILFRFTSFLDMKNVTLDVIETRYDEFAQACFYSTIAINKQLTEDSAEAYKFQKKAFDIWASKKEYGFMLITARHLLHLSQQLKMETKVNEYKAQIKKLLDSEALQGITEKTLFDKYQSKIKCAKRITQCLVVFERQQLPERRIEFIELKGWKLATKLKLLRALTQSKYFLNTNKNNDQIRLVIDHIEQTLSSLEKEKNILIIRNLQKSSFVKEAVNSLNIQLSKIVRAYQRANKSRKYIYLDKWLKIKRQIIKNQNQKKVNQKGSSYYTRLKQEEKKNILTRQIKQTQQSFQNIPVYSVVKKTQPKIQSRIESKNQTKIQPKLESKIQPKPQLKIQSKIGKKSQLIKQNSLTPRSERPVNQSINSVLTIDKLHRSIAKSIKICQFGQYFMKRNFSSDGGEQKFIRLTKSEIQWATDENKLQKSGKYQSYQLKQIRGILYGKISDTFKKPCNKQLECWKCFSLVLQKRTFDLYTDNQKDIIDWISGISGAVRKINPKNKELLLYTPGRVRWRKMFLMLYHHFYEPLKKNEKNKYFTIAHAIILFGKNNYKLPQKKKKLI